MLSKKVHTDSKAFKVWILKEHRVDISHKESQKRQYRKFYLKQATDIVETGDELDVDRRIKDPVLTKNSIDVIVNND